MRKAVNKWVHGLASAIITGFCSSGLAALGITAANSIGVQVHQLEFRQLMTVAIGGGIVGCLSYLKQSPLPPEDDETPAAPAK